MCAAFIAQQHGIALSTAFMKVPDPILDLWLVVAEFAYTARTQKIDQQLGPSEGREAVPVMKGLLPIGKRAGMSILGCVPWS
jgi:hypothetical protein